MGSMRQSLPRSVSECMLLQCSAPTVHQHADDVIIVHGRCCLWYQPLVESLGSRRSNIYIYRMRLKCTWVHYVQQMHPTVSASDERETYRPGPDSTRTAQQLVLALTNSTFVHAKIDGGNQPCDATSQVNPPTGKHVYRVSFLNSKRKNAISHKRQIRF